MDLMGDIFFLTSFLTLGLVSIVRLQEVPYIFLDSGLFYESKTVSENCAQTTNTFKTVTGIARPFS